LVTLEGSVVPLSEQLLAALQPTWETRQTALYAQGQVPAAIEVAVGQPVNEPIHQIAETLVLAPSRLAICRAASERTSVLLPRDTRFPLVYTAASRPRGWPR
jgi:hypothetical protein